MEDIDVRRGLAEILEMAAKEKKNENKVAVLTMNDSPQLRKMIKYILDPEVVWWDFLKGDPPPYKANRYLDAEGRLFYEMRILYMFCEGGDDWMGLKHEQYLTRAGLQQNPQKRQRIWIQLLESISEADAILLCHAPKKELPFKGLPRKIIDEAFPGLLAPEGAQPAVVVPEPVFEEKPAPAHGIAPQRPATVAEEFEYKDEGAALGKSRSRDSYDDDGTWEEKEERFNRRREKRNVRNVASVIDELIKKDVENAKT